MGRLVGRLLVLSILFVVPLIFNTQVKRNFEFAKFITFRYYVMAALLVWLGVRYRWRDWASPGRAPWAVFLFGAVVSTAMAPNMTESFDVSHLPALVGMFVFFEIVYSLARRGRFIHLCAILVAVQLGLASLYGIMQDLGIDKTFLSGTGFYFGVNNQAVSTMGNINFAGEYQVAAFPIVLALVLAARSAGPRIFFIIIAILADWNFVAQDTDGSNIGFFLGMLAVIPLGMWIWPRKSKLLVFFTAGGFAVEGVYTVFQAWWNQSEAYWIAMRNPDAVSVRGADALKTARDYFTQAQKGSVAFHENLPHLLQDFWVAILIALVGAAWFYGIPALARSRARAGVAAEAWIALFRRRLLKGAAVAAVVLVVIGGPVYVARSISKTNALLESGGTIPAHAYINPQPSAEHPYTLRDFIIQETLSQWTYVFRWECWQAASKNLVDNRFPILGLPVLGIGTGNFKVTHPLYASQLERKLLGAEVLARKVHNEWLATALESGFFGIFGQIWLFVVFFYCAWLVAKRLRRRYKDDPNESWGGAFAYFFLLAAVCSLVGTGFHNGVSSNLLQPSSSVVAYWVGAAVCAMAFPLRKKETAPSKA